MKRPRGTVLLVTVLLSILMFRISRVAPPVRDEFPAFYVNNPEHVTIYLGSGFKNKGYHQIIDGMLIEDVIHMAGFQVPPNLGKSLAEKGPLRSGEGLEISSRDLEVIEVERFFVPAAQRITLGIPLHPDTMKANDWQALPGIGPRLAERIVVDRQKNGEFGSLKALTRVKGIGNGTIKRLKEFF
ncbi:MAG: ComEA family DNA-binding protein [Pedobacter sp.]